MPLKQKHEGHETANQFSGQLSLDTITSCCSSLHTSLEEDSIYGMSKVAKYNKSEDPTFTHMLVRSPNTQQFLFWNFQG